MASRPRFFRISGTGGASVDQNITPLQFEQTGFVFGMVRFRIRYEKIGPIRYTSHKDLLRIFRRSLAAARIPVCYSQGFNPHPRLSFGPSLRTGWEGLDEYMDVLLERGIDDLDTRCNATLPGGLKIVGCAQVEDSVPKLSADIKAARYEVTVDESNLANGRNTRWERFVRRAGATRNEASDKRPFGELEDELRCRFQSAGSGEDRDTPEPSLLEVRITEQAGSLRIEYLSTMHQGKSLFPEILERYFGDSLGMEVPMQVMRKALLVERHGAYHSPISKGVVQNLL